TVQATQEEEVVRRVLVQELGELEGVSLASFGLEREGERLELTVTVYAREELQEGAADGLWTALVRELRQPVSLHLIAIPVSEASIP
ncbi:MAG TPA: hypothetical protein VMW79_09055, partial [Anaerolineae bacterium]|nr:hypothetical protein [Anaerolineae bacterium]